MTALLNLEPRSAQATTKEPAIAFARKPLGHDRCICADLYTRVGTNV
jgi:hypothetical protein